MSDTSGFFAAGGLAGRWARVRQALAPFVLLLTLACLIAWREPRFLSGENLSNVVARSVPLALIAVGETLIIIGGHIDLSVGSVMALAAVVGAILLREGQPLVVGVLAAVAVGGLCGFVNGLVTTRARMPSFIVTLAMMGLARGLALLLTEARTVSGDYLFGLRDVVLHKLLGLPVSVWLLLAVALAVGVLLGRTVFGRNLYALGANPLAARLSGVRVDRNVVTIFTLAGLLVGAAGAIEAARNVSAQPTMGQLKELDAIAAAVIGGASLAGGQGTVGGTLLGVAIMEVLTNGANLLNIANEWEKVIIGPLIVLAVLYDRWARRPRA